MKYASAYLLVACLLLVVDAMSVRADELKLSSSDGQAFSGTLVKSGDSAHRIMLLFHQARSNRHEYDPILSVLNDAGFDTLAIDQRSGGPMWDNDNQTVKAAGESTDYASAFPELQATLDWAVSQNYKTIVTVGSSYSAALNFVLAKENGKKLTAIASFSPGEYLDGRWSVAESAKGLDLPVYVTSGSSDAELSQVDDILEHAELSRLTRHKPKTGVHGASTLREDRNPGGYEENLSHFLSFLDSLK